MEKLRQLIKGAKESLNIADHLAYVTYPQVKEMKLLYLVIENLYRASSKAMDALLRYERLYKRIPVVQGSFDYELELFKDSIERYAIDRHCVLLIQDLKSIVEARKRSPIEFARRDRFVICSDNYDMRVLDQQKVRNFVAETKEFIEKVNKAIRC